ncbi:MAG: sodium ion-translocating decarboxylase subunit beta, partial [Bacteroidaceae bacterium]|nr:sodium ion-translocating decarboxylase subunit beta [Bacteroidaceae bacterium]
MNKFFGEMGFTSFFIGEGWKNAVMIGIACLLLYLAIKKEYEPLLLLPIAFGMLLSNIPDAGLFHTSMWNDEFLNPASPYYHSYRHVMAEGGLLDVLYIGVKAGVYPCLIFLGVGAMTDFGP